MFHQVQRPGVRGMEKGLRGMIEKEGGGRSNYILGP